MLLRTFQPGDEHLLVEMENAYGAEFKEWKTVRAASYQAKLRSRKLDAARIVLAFDGDRLLGFAALRRDGQIEGPLSGLKSKDVDTALLQHLGQLALTLNLTKLTSLASTKHAEMINRLNLLGFTPVANVTNFIQRLTDLPTMYLRRSMVVESLKDEEFTELMQFFPLPVGVTESTFKQYYFANPSFSRDALFTIRSSGELIGVGLFIEDRAFPVMNQYEGSPSRFLTGSFGFEHYSSEAVTGLFSYLPNPNKDPMGTGLDLLGYANQLITDDQLEVIGAQAFTTQSDVYAFYSRYFRVQADFQIFELPLASIDNLGTHP